MLTVIRAFLAPYLTRVVIYGCIALAAAGTLTGVYFKIRHDEKVRVLAQIEKEKADAINQAQDARNRFRDLCSRDSTCQLPDNWFRD